MHKSTKGYKTLQFHEYVEYTYKVSLYIAFDRVIPLAQL